MPCILCNETSKKGRNTVLNEVKLQYKIALFNAEDSGPLSSVMTQGVGEVIDEAELAIEAESLRRNLSEQFISLFEMANWNMDENLYFQEAQRNTKHFKKDGILVIVSWRHYNTIGTELLKFQADYMSGRIDAGVFVCITDGLNSYFEEVIKGKKDNTGFGTSITMEKAMFYIRTVSDIITVPIAVMGILPV